MPGPKKREKRESRTSKPERQGPAFWEKARRRTGWFLPAHRGEVCRGVIHGLLGIEFRAVFSLPSDVL